MIVCGTGHRPDKLGGYPFYEKVNHDKLVEIICYFLWRNSHPRCENPEDEVISGGALGFDQALATAAYIEGVPYRLYLPFEDFDCKWPDGSRRVLASQMKKAVEVRYICEPGYAAWKMQKRNEAMVNDANAVLALWNGTSGGTANCIRYAEKVGRPVINLWDAYAAAI